MNHRICLGLDLDGVLYDWHSAVYTYYQYEKKYDGTYHEFWTEYFNSLSKEEQEYVCNMSILYETQIPPKSVVEFLKFASKNAEMYYITKRPELCATTTRNYLKRWNFPFQDNLFITADKAMVCKLVGVTHFLDDHVKYIEEISKIANAYLMAKCWNFDYQDKYNTVYGINDFRRAVFNESI